MNDRTNLLQIDADRLWDTMMASARIGPGRGQGLRRLALDASDKEMRDLFVAWCREAGATVSIDKMGNIFARRTGREHDAAPVLVGSHLDTQYTGGKFDGILGVLAGLEVIRTLNEHGIETRRSIEVVNWSNEEDARFNPPMLASAVFAGLRNLDWAYARTDNDGVTYGSALAEIGYVGDAEMGGRDIDAYFELHIEQGPILEQEGVAVGVVTHGYTTQGMRLRINGETAPGRTRRLQHDPRLSHFPRLLSLREGHYPQRSGERDEGGRGAERERAAARSAGPREPVAGYRRGVRAPGPAPAQEPAGSGFGRPQGVRKGVRHGCCATLRRQPCRSGWPEA